MLQNMVELFAVGSSGGHVSRQDTRQPDPTLLDAFTQKQSGVRLARWWCARKRICCECRLHFIDPLLACLTPFKVRHILGLPDVRRISYNGATQTWEMLDIVSTRNGDGRRMRAKRSERV